MVSASARLAEPKYYNDCLGPILFDPFAADLVQRLPERPPGNVLEIAGGTGLVTKRLRERVDPSLRLVATDLSKVMLDYARATLHDWEGIEWREADALELPFEDNTFGAVVCGFGIMLMPDRQAVLKEARRVLAEGGILLFNVWDCLNENPHAAVNAAIVEAMFPGDSEMQSKIPFDMHDVALLQRLLAGAHFRETCIETKRIPIVRADPLTVAIGQIRGTPRAAYIEKRGVSVDLVIEKVADALTSAGGDPYNGYAQAVVVKALAL